MIDKFCEYITEKTRQKMPEIDDEKAEIISFGYKIMFGEIPKFFIMLLIAWGLGVLELSILTFLIIMPYRMYSGGFHAHTHIGCIISTSVLYSGTAVLSRYIMLEPFYIKYILIFFVWFFGMIMIKKYAPADTEDVPVISKKERKKRKVISSIIFSILLILAIFIKNQVVSNIIILGVFIQTLTITRVVYKLTNSRYGHELYEGKTSSNRLKM